MECTGDTRSNTSALSCRGVSRSFGGLTALNAVDIDVKLGAITALIGPNGAGKTTLFNVISGFDRGYTGECFLNGKRMTRHAPERIARSGMGRSFQELRVFSSLTVKEHIFIARKRARGNFSDHVRDLLSITARSSTAADLGVLSEVGLAGFGDEYPGHLSYGQQKLLTMAMILAMDSAIMMLDEPVAGVAPSMVNEIAEIMLRSKKSAHRTIFFIEHDVDFVRQVADHVIVMSEGRIISTGATTDVLERSEIIEAYLG